MSLDVVFRHSSNTEQKQATYMSRSISRYNFSARGDRDDADNDGTEADDELRAGNPGAEASPAIFGHDSLPGAVHASLNL